MIIKERSISRGRKESSVQRRSEDRVARSCSTSDKSSGHRSSPMTGVRDGRRQRSVELDTLNGGDRWTEVPEANRRVVAHRDTPLKRKETHGIETDRNAKFQRVHEERHTHDFDVYEDNIELEDPQEEVGCGILDHRNGGVERRGEETTELSRGHGTGRCSEKDTGRREDNTCAQPAEEQQVNGKRDIPTTGRRDEGKIGCTDDHEEDSQSDSDSSTCSDSSSSSGESGDDGIQSRALDILKKGAMPMCPPARRDWSSTRQVELSYNNQVLCWPPDNFDRLSPDQRLLAFEFAAVMLEKRGLQSFPSTSRKELLDKYGFLLLENSGTPQEEEAHADKLGAKLRQYNLAYIKSIGRGEIKSSKAAWGIVKAMEFKDRWTDTDEITEKLDSWGIKLKI